MVHRHALAAPLPRLIRRPRDLLVSVLFVFLATWPFVAGVVLLKRLLAAVF